MRLTVTIPLVALSAMSLVITPSAATPPATSAAATAACSHTHPRPVLTDALRLQAPTSATDHRQLGDVVAEGVTDSLRSSEPLTDTGRPTSGLPYGLSQGVIGVLGSASTGYKVLVDDSVDQTAYRAKLAKQVPPEGMKAVAFERGCRPAKAIAAAWTKVSARDWSPAAKKTTFIADLDPATEQIVVEYDRATTSPDTVAALTSIDPTIVRAVPGSPQRMTRLSDTPTGGHWGGARISSVIRDCTAGFTVVRRSTGGRASVTAGHCGGVGTAWYSGSNYYGTTSVRTNYPDYDQALLTGSTYGPKIWTDGAGDTEDVRTVTGAGDPAIGSLICQSGSYSRSLCSITVQSLSATFCDENGCTTYVMKGTKGGQIVIRAGDSGGPIYTKPGADSATIRGASIAGSGCSADHSCTTIYAERYNSIAGHLGVYVLTG